MLRLLCSTCLVRSYPNDDSVSSALLLRSDNDQSRKLLLEAGRSEVLYTYTVSSPRSSVQMALSLAYWATDDRPFLLDEVVFLYSYTIVLPACLN